VADAVLVDDVSVPTDSLWTGRLAARLPEATRGLVLGANAMVAEVTQKAALHRVTGASAVDMESHVVARVAQRHRLPFAVARVVSDAAHHSLPPAARVGMKSDGRMDLSSVLRSLLENPRQLPALIRTGFEAEQGFRALLRGYRRLGPGLAGPDLI
jgi:nucleoside phosphorylase